MRAVFTRRALLAGLAILPLSLVTARPVLAGTPVKIGYIPVLGSAQLFVLNGAGWAKEAGLDLQLIRFESGPVMIQALASGQLDAYVAGVGPVLVAKAQGIDVKIVAALAIEELAVLARGDLAAAATDSPKAALTQFAQKSGRKPKIATQPRGSVPDTFLRYWLDQGLGIPLDQVDIVGVGIDTTQQMFLSGAIDAAVLREPTLTLVADREPSARIIATGGQMFADQPGSVLAIYQPGQPERQAIADILVRLVARATKLITENPKQAAPYIHDALGGGMLPLTVIERALASKASHFITDPARIIDATRRMQNYQLKLGVIPAAAPIDQVFDTGPFQRAGS